jgi:hypothetical protein
MVKKAKMVSRVATPPIVNSVDGITPGIQIKNISLKHNKNGLKTTVTILIRETMSRRSRTPWFTKLHMMKNFSLKIVQCENELGHKRFLSDPVSKHGIIKRNSTQGFQEKIINVFDYLKKSNLNFGLSDLSKYYVGESGGKKRFQIPIEVDFEIQNANPMYLKIYAIPMMADDDPWTRKSPHKSRKYDMGKVKYARVIANGEISKEASIFVTEGGKLYPGDGPVHYHPENNPDPSGYVGYMAGATHSHGNQPKLSRAKVSNMKVHDYRQLQTIDELFNLIENNLKTKNTPDNFNKMGAPGQIASGISGIKLNHIPNLPVASAAKSAGVHFSDLYLTISPFDVPSMCFGFNKKAFARDKTLFGDFLARSGRSLRGYCGVESIKLLRRRVTVGTNYKYFAEDYENDKEEILTELLSPNGRRNQNLSPSVAEPSKTGGSLNELTGISNDDEVMYYSASDGSMKRADGGKYQYGIEMVMTDNTSEYFKRMRRNLISATDKLNSFLMMVDQTKSYKKHSKTYDYDFVQNIMLTAPHRSSIKHFLRALQELSGAQETAQRFENISRFLVNITSPSSGSPDGIRLLLGLINSLIERINKLLEGTETNESHIVGNAENKAGQTRSKKPRRIKVKTFFSNTHYDANGYRGTGIDFLSSANTSPYASAGIKFVSPSQYLIRVEREMEKYFTKDAQQSVGSMNLTAQDEKVQEQNFEQLELNKFAFLTPSVVKVDGQPPFENFHADSLDFNKKKYNSVLLNMHAAGPSSPMVPIQTIKNPNVLVKNTDKKGIKNKPNSNIDNTMFNQLKNNSSKSGVSVSLKGSKPKNFNFALMKNKTGKKDTDLNPITDINTKDKKTKGEKIQKEKTSVKMNNALFDLVVKNEINGKNSSNEPDSLESFKLENIKNDSLENESGESLKYGSGIKAAALSQAPPQIKHLSFLKSNTNKIKKVNFKNDKVVASEDYGYFYLNYKLLCQVEYIQSYGTDKRGEIQVNNPVWAPITAAAVESASQGIQHICRIRYYSNSKLKITQAESLRLPIYDEYFILGLASPQRRTRRVINTPNLNILRSVDKIEVDSIAGNFLVLPEDSFLNPDPKRLMPYIRSSGKKTLSSAPSSVTLTTAIKHAQNIESLTSNAGTAGTVSSPMKISGTPSGGGTGGGGTGGGGTGGGGMGGSGGGY